MNDSATDRLAALGPQERLFLIGSAGALLGCFLSWFTGSGLGGQMSISIGGVSYWQGKMALLALAVGIGTLIYGAFHELRDEQRALHRKIQFGGAGVAALMVLWFWVNIPSVDTAGPAAMGGVEFGSGAGLWLTFIGAGAAALVAFKRLSES